MPTKLLAAALIALSGVMVAAEVQARTCQTITYTVYRKRCHWGHGNHYCWRIPMTKTRQICTNNTPKIRRVPQQNDGRFTKPREVPPSIARRFITDPRTPNTGTPRIDTFRRTPKIDTQRFNTFRQVPKFNSQQFSIRRRS